jgi:glyoxylase-like metal-dependent hydrolase (beta-lactamase superfamily II)
MSDIQAPPPPVIGDTAPEEIAEGVFVIPDGRVPLVPNVGIVVGQERALVVDTGMGPANGRRVLEKTRALTDRPLVLTLSHFHPEHGFGAQSLPDAHLVYNRAQKDELDEKGLPYVEMFRTFGEAVSEQLEGVELRAPDELYDGQLELDLGGVAVELREVGTAHTRGDQVVFLPERGVLFAGDLLETRFFSIFPPGDPDVSGAGWIEVLRRLERLGPELVVPGHGEVRGPELIGVVRAYLEDVQGRVREAISAGRSAEEAKDLLEPQIRAAYPSWDAPEWIGFAVESFHAELGDG